MPSTVVAHMDYNAEEHKLRITFVSGLVYNYLDVPEMMYERMKSAKSKGTFLNRHIKGKYNFEKVTSL
jgi:hypothetical protein